MRAEGLTPSYLALLLAVLTDGNPTIVGSSILLHSDVSDCCWMELIVCEVTCNDATLLREAVAGLFEVELALRFAMC
jgi:hypothetical protein